MCLGICFCMQGALRRLPERGAYSDRKVQSVSQTLHTATTSIIRPLVDYYVGAEDEEAAYTLVRRVLTALIHHCKDKEQFSGVADMLVAQFEERVKDPTDEERLRRVLEVASVVCSVRQGSRMLRAYFLLLCALHSG